MSNREHILKRAGAELRPSSIYGGSGAAHNQESMKRLLDDATLPLSLKYTAIFVAYAYMHGPLTLASFGKLIPETFWNEHFAFGYCNYGQGPAAVYYDLKRGEMNYHLNLGPVSSYYGIHVVEFVSDMTIMPKTGGLSGGRFYPPLDAPVYRFALKHPFLHWELHDGEEIYLFANN